MEAINPWTRIPERASMDDFYDDSRLGNANAAPPLPVACALEPELAPPPSAQLAPPPPAATGSGFWTGEPPPHIPER